MRYFLIAIFFLASLPPSHQALSNQNQIESWSLSKPLGDWQEISFFSISLQHSGNLVCGRADASAMGTNRLDRSLLVGHTTARGIEIFYTSSYSAKGVARALLIRRNNTLTWKPIGRPIGWFWAETELKRAQKPYTTLHFEDIKRCQAVKAKLDARSLTAQDLYVEP